VAEAVGAAFGIWQRQKEAAESGGQPLSFEKLIDDYVSDLHRKNPGMACAFSALAPEIARSDKRTRALTSEQMRNDLELIVGLLPGLGVPSNLQHPWGPWSPIIPNGNCAIWAHACQSAMDCRQRLYRLSENVCRIQSEPPCFSGSASLLSSMLHRSSKSAHH
jgi:hypothetical protein